MKGVGGGRQRPPLRHFAGPTATQTVHFVPCAGSNFELLKQKLEFVHLNGGSIIFRGVLTEKNPYKVGPKTGCK